MTKETLKKLISNNLIDVTEAIWLSKLTSVVTKNENNIDEIVEQLLNSLIKTISTIKDLSLEDELFFFSIQNNLNNYLRNIQDEENEDIEDEDEEDYGFYSKEELEKLRKTEEEIIAKGYSELLYQLMNIIETKYQKVYNGFNKVEYQRAKSAFWKMIGLEENGYFELSPPAKKLLDDVYSGSEPLIRKKVEEKELEILPTLSKNFRSWIAEFQHKPNRTNLSQYLKNNNIKLSNPNMDKILSQFK